MFCRGIGQQLDDARLEVRENDQSRVQAGEKTTEPIACRIAVADSARKGGAFGLVQVVRCKRIEDRAPAWEIPIDVGSGEAAGSRNVGDRELAVAVNSKKPLGLEQDAGRPIRSGGSQGTVQPRARARLARYPLCGRDRTYCRRKVPT